MDTSNFTSNSSHLICKQHEDQSDEDVCDRIIQNHFANCELWKQIASRQLIRRYVLYYLQIWKIRTFVCADILLLHRYAQQSGEDLPPSRGSLRHFWQTGKIPTSNLHLLSPSILTVASQCGLCNDCILPGANVYQLECGHVYHCHVSSTNNVSSRCSIQGWLQTTNQCPSCKKLVSIGGNKNQTSCS